MQELTADNFQLASCQATIFTPDGDLAVSKVMKDLYPSLTTLFDGALTTLGTIPQGAPPEIPRIIIESKSHEWRCEFSSARVNVHWRRAKSTGACVAIGDFFEKAVGILLQYAALLSPRIARLAALTTRFSVREEPGLFLARHFCKDRWDKAPLNRPENFELHAHKRYTLADDFTVNSWAKSKTGKLSEAGDEKLIVLFEQDLNTLKEDATEKDFGEADVKKFFGAAANELDSILELYYPGT
ncbi:MAG: hypothetical protein IID36_04535 [Planctomycetes bacterium]|nr:hypothetical protein [Planctomycetota bacterium]